MQQMKPKGVVDAIRVQSGAAIKRAIADSMAGEHGDHTGARFHRAEADAMEASAAQYLDPLSHITGPMKPGNGGEMIAATREMQMEKPGIIDTVRERPDMLAAVASYQRLDLAGDAGVLTLAVDAAETIKARNSLERMLAHEMAAAHRLSLRFVAQADEELRAYTASRHQTRAVEAARLANTAARLMDSFQSAMLALDRIRRGGHQTVNVIHQHVEVGAGGAAVVGGSIKAEPARPGGRRK